MGFIQIFYIIKFSLIKGKNSTNKCRKKNVKQKGKNNKKTKSYNTKYTII